MDLRRWGEFAFGIGVFMCGGAFLLLALERMNAPVVTGVQSTPSIVAVAAQPTAAAVVRPAPIAFVRRPTRPRRPNVPHRVAVRPQPATTLIVAAIPIASHVRALAAPPPFEPQRALSQPPKHAASPPQQRHKAALATVRRPAPTRSTMPRVLAVANPVHRSKNVGDRSPMSERTPEPPIGYDDHPALLRSEGPSAAMPATAPVQVELTTTHLGH